MSKLAKSLACLLLGAPLLPAAAADFTLEVPLHIQNAPSIVSVSISCAISRMRVDEPSPLGGTNVVGRGSQTVRTLGADQDTVVTIVVNADSIIPASDARSYWCSMNASGTARTGGGYAASSGNFQDVYQTATGQTLERVTASVRGNLP